MESFRGAVRVRHYCVAVTTETLVGVATPVTAVSVTAPGVVGLLLPPPPHAATVRASAHTTRIRFTFGISTAKALRLSGRDCDWGVFGRAEELFQAL